MTATATAPAAVGRPPTAAAAGCAIATVALTTLTLAGVFSLTRLFATHAYVGPVVGVAVGTHISAWLGRWLRWPPATTIAASLVTVILLTSWLVLPGSTYYGLPLLGTLHAAARALHQATVDFHNVTSPAPVNQGFLLVTAATVGLFALLADWAAFRMRATLEATVPSFTLFVFCAALGSHKTRTLAIVVEVVALLAFVVIHQSTTDQETSAWFANRTEGALRAGLSTGAVIGLAAVIVALNLGFRLPQANAKALVAWRNGDRGGNGTRNTLSPQVDLRGRLLNNTTTPVFTVKTSVASYWRLTSLDNFDGVNWSALGNYHPIGRRLTASTAVPAGQRVEQDFTIATLTEPWLPAAYQPDSIDGIKGVTYDPQSGSLISAKDTTTGLSYHVSSIINTGELRPATLATAPAPPQNAAMARDLQLPALPPEVVALAQQIVAGKNNEYDKAVAIQDYLRDPARYTYNLGYEYSGPDPLGHFLLVARQGYCQQFAGSYAVLARLAGLPTRLAYGFSYGIQASPGTFEILDNQAHTWPEVYFTSVGWVSFEPTPQRGIPGAQAYTGVAPAEASPADTTAPAVPTTVANGPAVTRTTPTTIDRSGGTGAAKAKAHHRSGLVTTLVWLAILLAIIGLVVGTVRIIRWVRRLIRREATVGQAAELEDHAARRSRVWDRFARFRQSWAAEGLRPSAAFVARVRALLMLEWLLPLLPRRAEPDPAGSGVITRAEVLLAWSEAIDLLAWWGVRRYPSETYIEFGRRAVAELRGALSIDPEACRALVRLAQAGTRGEFDTRTLGDDEVARAADDLAAVRRALLTSASSGQKLRLAVDPRLMAKTR